MATQDKTVATKSNTAAAKGNPDKDNKDYRRKVYACAFQNDSDTDAKAILTYEEAIDKATGEKKRKRFELDVEKGKRRYVLEKITTMDRYNIRHVVDHVEIVRADGTKFELKAPFEGVTDPVTKWLFVIENDKLKSAGSWGEEQQ